MQKSASSGSGRGVLATPQNRWRNIYEPRISRISRIRASRARLGWHWLCQWLFLRSNPTRKRGMKCLEGLVRPFIWPHASEIPEQAPPRPTRSRPSSKGNEMLACLAGSSLAYAWGYMKSATSKLTRRVTKVPESVGRGKLD
jgi:hypothetical protein